ncbi:MAG: hypothetical protein LBT91_02090 [Bifidobacteriaceae bacterium]|jgi:hypothetical protein|nr:hypothetical protein [Bifidobacteriaceae bacterium]
MKFIKIKKFALFIFPILFIALSFLSGIQFNSKSAVSSEILPASRGGTGASTPAGASNNLLGENFANYDGGILPITKGGTGESSGFLAMQSLGNYPSYEYGIGTGNSVYIKVASVSVNSTNSGIGNQSVIIAGMFDFGSLPILAQLTVSGRDNSAIFVNYSPYCYDYGYTGYAHNFMIYSVDVEDASTRSGLRRDFYAKSLAWLPRTRIVFISDVNKYSNIARDLQNLFTPDRLSSLPEDAVPLTPLCLESQKVENL